MTKKKHKEEPAPVEEPPAPVEPPPPTFRDLLLAMWEEPDLVTQRRLTSEMMEMPDGPSHSLQCIRLDDIFSHLLLAKEAGMNPTQTEELLALMKSVMEGLSDAGLTTADSFTNFKQKLMANCALVHAKSRKQLEEEAIAKAKAEEEAKIAEAERLEAEAKEKKAAKGKHKGKKGEPEEPEEELRAPSPVKIDEPSHFTAEQVRIIADYVTTGVYGHYFLSQAVFTDQFENRKNRIIKDIKVESVIADGLSLNNAIEIVEDEVIEEEEGQQTISMMVEARLLEAQVEMAQKLKANEDMLNARLKAMEAKLAKKK